MTICEYYVKLLASSYIRSMQFFPINRAQQTVMQY